MRSKLKPGVDAERYIGRAAKYLFYDMEDWDTRQPNLYPSDNPWPADLPYQSANYVHNIAELVEEYRMDYPDVKKACLYVDKPGDRFLAILFYLYEYSYKQINALTGWPINAIENGMKRARRSMRRKAAGSYDFLSDLHPWEKDMAFTMDRQPISAAYVNIFPHKFDRDHQRMLLKDLDVSSMRELWEQYIALLRIEMIDSPSPSLFMTFMPRIYFSDRVFEQGEEIQYASYLPQFLTKETRGNKQGYLAIHGKHEFPGRVTVNYIAQGNYDREFEYQFRTINMKSRKAFDPTLVSYKFNPHSRKSTIWVYRNYPIDHRKQFPLAV